MSTLDNVRKAAKRWLKALRANDADARARLVRAYPKAAAHPTLRDVQHALARERGHESWTDLRRALDQAPRDAERVATFLEFACWDHHVHGKGDHRMYDRAAARLLAQHPEIARDSLYTSIVCGERREVERILAERPDAAREPGGSRGWTPLLYLSYTRFTHPATIGNALAIARALLDRGADPNDYYMAGDARYTALVGVAGEGEQDSPRQPYAEELFQLLLERGAEPFDIQVLYDTHFSGDMLWWLELIYAHTITTDRAAAWKNPSWSMLDMGGYGSGARFLLYVALEKNDLRLAEWLLAHGADPNAAPAQDKRLPKRSLYEEAMVRGFTEMADLLARYGAVRSVPVLNDEEAFINACLRQDRDAVRAHLETHAEYLQSPNAMFVAAQLDRVDVVQFLLDLGTPADVRDSHNTRPLHHAAGNDAFGVARLLIDRGAEIDPAETKYGSTPIGWAAHGDHRQMVDFLSRFTRHVWNLAFGGYVERLRDVLSAEPNLAKLVTNNGITPLWWLPDDEQKALDIVELFLAHGADPALKSKEGKTAADWALKRGMLDVARRLAVTGDEPRPGAELERYRNLAKDILTAHESGEPAALQRVQQHFGQSFTWEELRKRLRQNLASVRGADPGTSFLDLDTVQLLLARNAGFQDWTEFAKALDGTPPARQAFAIDKKDNKIRPYRKLLGSEWDTLIDAMKEMHVASIDAQGQMTDAVLERIAALDHVTRLDLAGSKQVTDEGLRHLARLPQLEYLDVSGCRISDRGLEVLRHLSQLTTFKLYHQRGISDAGVANLTYCDRLEHVDLMNTTTGDGAINALRGKSRLSYVKGGNLVTDVGVRLLHDFPIFKTWHGGEVKLELMSPDARPNFLWLYLNAAALTQGLANLSGLDGVFALSVFSGSGSGPFDSSNDTPPADGLVHLANLPNLGFLSWDCNDEAMRHISRIPGLRFLMCQDTIAGDEGFVALSASRTLEYIWGRRCYNLKGRGFTALSTIPALRGLSVSCKNVDEDALASLPRFPALREYMPMDVPDEGFHHVGRCAQLEALWCMYCRDTTDAATERIAGLSRLKTYYAGQTRMTDRSLEILGRMPSLESVRFWSVAGVTDAGLPFLARLPRLREVELHSMPNVTLEGAAVFPPNVRVDYSA